MATVPEPSNGRFPAMIDYHFAFLIMTTRHVVTGSLATSSVVGLTSIATGIVPWGVRAVALFTLLGFAWLFLLFVLFSVDVYERTGRNNE